jgi:hypothetical protein
MLPGQTPIFIGHLLRELLHQSLIILAGNREIHLLIAIVKDTKLRGDIMGETDLAPGKADDRRMIIFISRAVKCQIP